MPKKQPAVPPDTRQKILDAAASAFAELGFAGARVDDIAQRAGVNKALVYYYVGDKQALFEAIFEQIVGEGVTRFESAIASASTNEERIEKAVQNLALMVRTQPHFAPIVLRAIASGGEGLAPSVARTVSRMYVVLMDTLERGHRAGEFRQVDPILTTMMLAGAVLFLNAGTPFREGIRSLIRPEDVGRETPESLAAEVARIMLHGIVEQPSPASRKPRKKPASRSSR